MATSEQQYQQYSAQLQQQAQGVQAAATSAAASADFFAPERGRYIQGLQQLMTGGQSAIAADPSAQFRFKQGQSAVESSLAAQGLLGSGGAALELQKYGQESASQEFQAQYQRLFQLAGVEKSDPTAAANIMMQGARAPMEAMGQIASQSSQALESERGRWYEQSMAGVRHQQELEKLRYGSSLQATAGSSLQIGGRRGLATGAGTGTGTGTGAGRGTGTGTGKYVPIASQPGLTSSSRSLITMANQRGWRQEQMGTLR